MALDPNTPYTDNGLNKGSREAWVDRFVSMYVKHSKEGTCSTVIISGTGESNLKSDLLALSGWSNNVNKLAKALASYWSAEVTPNPPHISVSNNAQTKISDFEVAIQNSISENVKNKSIVNFLESTDAVVNSIDYIGQKPTGNGTIPVTDNVS